MFLVSVRLYIAGAVYQDWGATNYFACKSGWHNHYATYKGYLLCVHVFGCVISTATNTNSPTDVCHRVDRVNVTSPRRLFGNRRNSSLPRPKLDGFASLLRHVHPREYRSSMFRTFKWERMMSDYGGIGHL